MDKNLKDRIVRATLMTARRVCPACYQSVPYGHSTGRCFEHKDLPVGSMGAVVAPLMSIEEMQDLISDLQAYIEKLHAQLPT